MSRCKACWNPWLVSGDFCNDECRAKYEHQQALDAWAAKPRRWRNAHPWIAPHDGGA